MQQTEILVIGGGIAGASTAYYLTQHGHEVTLLERSEIATEASGLNAGPLWATGWGTTPHLSSTLSMGGLEILKTLQFDLGQDIEFRQSGSLKAISTEEEYAFIQEEVNELRSKGHQVELLTARDARSIEPELSPDVLGCLYYPFGGNANPVKTTRTLASLAQQQGAAILSNHEVTGMQYLHDGTYQVVRRQDCSRQKPSSWQQVRGVDLSGQYWVSTFQCLLCVARYGLLVLFLPGYFHSMGAAESALYWHKAPYSDENTPPELTHRGDKRLTRHLYGRQTRDGEIIVGGDRQVEVARMPDPAGIEINRHHAIEIFPFLRELPIKRTWAGWMPFTRDLRPMIGKIPHFKNLYILTGLGSSGFEQGPMAGKLLADYIHNGVASPRLSQADPTNSVNF